MAEAALGVVIIAMDGECGFVVCSRTEVEDGEETFFADDELPDVVVVVRFDVAAALDGDEASVSAAEELL